MQLSKNVLDKYRYAIAPLASTFTEIDCTSGICCLWTRMKQILIHKGRHLNQLQPTFFVCVATPSSPHLKYLTLNIILGQEELLHLECFCTKLDPTLQYDTLQMLKLSQNT